MGAKHPNFSEIKHKPECFVVKHYAGPVTYTSEGFVTKNKDALPKDMLSVMLKSERPYVLNLFKDYVAEQEKVAEGDPTRGGVPVSKRVGAAFGNGSGMSGGIGKAKQNTLCSIFRNQLDSLMKTLGGAEPHFIRCIKPNLEKKPDLLDRRFVCEQLRYQGVLAVVEAQRAGYPVRLTHEDFWAQVRCLMSVELKRKVKAVKKGSVGANRRGTGENKERTELSREYLAYLRENYRLVADRKSIVGGGQGTGTAALEDEHDDAEARNPHEVQKSKKGALYAIGKTLVFLKQNIYEQLRQLVFKLQDDAQKIIAATVVMRKVRRRFTKLKTCVVKVQAAARGLFARARKFFNAIVLEIPFGPPSSYNALAAVLCRAGQRCGAGLPDRT